MFYLIFLVNQTQSPSITDSIAHEVLRHFATGDLKTVSPTMGLTLVFRTTGSWRSGEIHGSPLDNTILDGKATQPKWTEYYQQYTKDEVQKTQILRIVKRIDETAFCDLSKPAKFNWQDRLLINAEDAWHQRLLNNALEIKIASNAKFYIYFTLESGHWRIYRVEESQH